MTWFLSTRIGQAISAIFFAFVGVLTFGALKKREGAKSALQEVKNADQERADRVRDRVDGVERVQPDDIRFRD